MHEFGLAEDTLSVALRHAQLQGARRILKLRVQIGALAGVADEAFEFAWGALAEKTMADGAELVIEHVPVTCFCRACGREFETDVYAYACPGCGTASTDVRRGRELSLVSMEVE